MKGGEIVNMEVIVKVIVVCNKVGGGCVVIFEGEWLIGFVYFKSNVNFYLEENVILCFIDNFFDYLFVVMILWEGMECYNYFLLLYVMDCENIVIIGKGILVFIMDIWKIWFKCFKFYMDVLKELYMMVFIDVFVE